MWSNAKSKQSRITSPTQSSVTLFRHIVFNLHDIKVNRLRLSYHLYSFKGGTPGQTPPPPPGYALVITYSYHLILINFLCETNFEKLCLASSNFSQGNPKYHLKNEICGSKSRVSTKWFSVKDGSGRKFCETKWRWYPENLSVLLRTVAFSYLNLHWYF